MEKLEERLKSLTDNLDVDLAESYVVDSSVIGMHFIVGKHLQFDYSRARQNNLGKTEVKEVLRSAEAFVEFLRKYPLVSTVPKVIEECELTQRILGSFVDTFGRRNRHYNSGRQEYRHPSSVTKCSKILDSIHAKEREAIDILKGRLLSSEDTDSLEEYEELVVRASEGARQKNGKVNDEIIVASAIHYAHSNKKHVALITGDHRFPAIVRSVQDYLDCTLYDKDLRDFLLEGNLSVILKNKDGSFWVPYCSLDFADMLKPVNREIV